MDSNTTHNETKTDSTNFIKNRKRYQDLISTLPHTKGWRPNLPLIQYNGHWIVKPLLESSLYAQDFFQAKPNDILLCTYPKSGTTWLKALTFSIVNRRRFDDDSSNPILKHNPHELVPFIEIEFAFFPHIKASNDEHNTLFSTHLPYRLLPKSITKSGSKLVYIWRDPKDTFISMWTFFHKQKSDNGCLNSLEESFDMFCKGFSGYGPYFDHVLSYWKAYQENQDQILFLKYETMRSDPIPYVKRLAEFIGYGFTEEEVKKGVIENIVNLCSFETLKNLEANIGGKIPWNYYPNSAYFRKGNVGDWRNYLTPEMADRMDGLMKFKVSGLLEHGSG